MALFKITTPLAKLGGEDAVDGNDWNRLIDALTGGVTENFTFNGTLTMANELQFGSGGTTTYSVRSKQTGDFSIYTYNGASADTKRLAFSAGVVQGSAPIWLYESLIFDGDSTAALTAARTGIAANGVGGDMIANVPTGKAYGLRINGLDRMLLDSSGSLLLKNAAGTSRQFLALDSGGTPMLGDTAITMNVQTNLNPDTDNTRSFGTSTSTMWKEAYIKRIAHGSSTTLTVSSNTITVTQAYHKVDTSGGAQTINTINGGITGQLLFLQRSGANNLIIADAGTNVQTAAGRTLNADDDIIVLFYNGTTWLEVGWGDNA